MVEVFITDARSRVQTKNVWKLLENSFHALKFTFDLENEVASFPCGHSILRVEGAEINSESIVLTLKGLGYRCEVLEDKICK